MKIKKWDGSAWVQDYPEVNVSSIVATGTPSSTTFLRGDGTWATPADVDTNNYLTGVSGLGNGTVTFTRQGLSNLTWDASHNHSLGYFNSAITSNLDTLYTTGQFGWNTSTTGRPEDFGQGINIVSAGTAHNNTNNWITQLGFGTNGSTSYFRTKVNTNSWSAWRKIWNEANDGSGSGLDADLLDGQHGSYFLDTSGSTQTKSGSLNVSGNFVSSNNITGGRYYQSPNGIPTGNLGSPTITEMALFDEQFYNQTAFYDITKLKFYTSTDNSTWTEVTTISDTNKRALVGGDAGSGITIPNLTPYYRIEITNNGNYVFLNALYMYVTTNSHSMSIKIKARRRSDLTFVNITSSNNTVNLWPGHVYMPFNTIPFLTGGSSSGHYDIVHIDFQPTWSGDPTYGSLAINLHKLQIWGGYPAGKRNIYSTDENRNVAFPAALTGTRLFSTIATGTSPLSVTSTTVNTNLNADLLDGYHSSSFVFKSGDTSTGLTVFDGGIHVLSGTGGGKLRIKRNSNSTDGDDIVDIHLDDNSIYFDMDNDNDNDTGDFFFRYKTGGTFSNLLYIGPGTINYKGNTIWHAGNDGASSGLDADKVDNLEANQFIRSDEGDTAAGNHEFYGTDTSGSYAAAPIEIKEVNLVSNTQTADIYAPKLAFHWGGITQTSIFLSANGNLYLNGGQNGKILTTADEGSGNGIDADTLDGNHASAFLQTTARGAANGVAPLDATSKVPVANLPDFITGAGRGFYLVGTISGAVSLSAATTGLVAQLVALSGGDYKNMYGYMWTAAAEVTLTWTDQTTLGPTFQYHVLTPGDEGDSTSPVTLEAGDMIVFTKYSDTAGDGNDQQFTFSIINSSDPRFANYLPLTGGTMTGTITSTRSDGQTHNRWALISEPNNYYLDLNTVVTPSNVRWNFNQRNSGTNYDNVLVIDTGKIGIGTSSPTHPLHISRASGDVYAKVSSVGASTLLGTRSDGNSVLFNDTNDKPITFWTTVGGSSTEKMRLLANGNVGIGTTSPNQLFEIKGSGLTYAKVSSATNGSFRGVGFGIENDATIYGSVAMEMTNGQMRFQTGFAGWGGFQTFFTDGSERMRITSAGRLGIGTTSPDQLLHVAGQINLHSNLTWFNGNADINGADTNIKFRTYNGTALTEYMRLTSAGNLGIGTTAPVSKLDVVDTFHITNSQNTQHGIMIENRATYYDSTGKAGIWSSSGALTGPFSGQGAHLVIEGRKNSDRDIYIKVGDTTAASHVFKASGNVGINTLTPSEKLEVNGVAKATSFISTVALGTAPLTVTSSTKVNNLNADFLDGYDATSFMLASGMSSYAPLASPALTGTPTAPTATAGTNTTQIATTAFVSTAVANLINSAPGALDTLDELAAALGDDANFATTVTNSIAGKVSKSGDTMTGDLTISKLSPQIILSDTDGGTTTYPAIQFDTANNQGVRLYHTEFDSELPVAGYGLVLGASPNNNQFPGTATLSLAVLGEIYAGSTTLGSTQKVFHDGYHPNADTLTTARTLTIGSTGKTFNGSANVSWSLGEIGAAATSHTHAISDVTGLQTALDGKASTSHTHAISDVTNLQTSLDAKAADSAVVKLTGAQSVAGVKTFTSRPLADSGLDVGLNTGTVSDSITFNTAQTYTGPYIRGSAQVLQRGYYTAQYQIWDAESVPNPTSGTGTANQIAYYTGAQTLGSLSTATYPSLTELSYVKGVTSAIQTQLNRQITKYRATQQSSTSGNTNTTAVTSITLLANKYYHLDVTGMYSKTSTSGSTAPVITIAVDNATGTPTINGRFEWLNGSAATAYTVSNTNGAITTSTTARGFTAATATLNAITTTPWGLKALFYTGTSDKILTFYIAHSSSVSGTVAVDNISIHATEVLA